MSSVYTWLQEDGAVSHHGHATLELARRVVDAAPLPYRFNSKPPLTLRLFALASRHQLELVSPGMRPEARPESDLWGAAYESTRSLPDDPMLADMTVELLLRLGFANEASALLGLASTDPRDLQPCDIDVDLAIPQMHTLLRTSPDRGGVAELLLELSMSDRFSAYVRAIFAKNFVVYCGKTVTEHPELDGAVSHLTDGDGELELDDFHHHLFMQTVHRAVAFVPHMRGDVAATFDCLAAAEKCQREAVPTSRLDEIHWNDHAFPLYETMYKSALIAGNTSLALSAANSMIEVSHGADGRAWLALATSEASVEHLDEALTAARRAVALGGRQTAAGAFAAAQILGEFEEEDESRAMRDVAAAIDPLSPSLVAS
ncbi:MAG: hypothetical protein ACTJHM_03855 [Agrococcus casei]|uniref:hypothetical protein n=1 Tax=Agrococcus casei TaxID=343512 RepID=UPI003F8D9B32